MSYLLFVDIILLLPPAAAGALRGVTKLFETSVSATCEELRVCLLTCLRLIAWLPVRDRGSARSLLERGWGLVKDTAFKFVRED